MAMWVAPSTRCSAALALIGGIVSHGHIALLSHLGSVGAARVLTYHNSKYSLANHSWTEPLDSIYEHAKGQPWQLLTPRIGEPIGLDEQQTFRKWW